MLAFFLLSHPRVFSAHDLVKLPPFRNSYPGSHGTHSSPFPSTVLAFVLVSKKKKYRACLRFSRKNILRSIYSELGFLPWRPLASNWCAFIMQPTSIIRSTQAARRFLRSVRILMVLFQALISTRTNTYVISPYNLLVVYIHVISYRYHAIHRMISVSRYPEHILDIDIDISRKYRMIYRE